MAFLRVSLFFLVSVLGFCHSNYVDLLNKCSLEDKVCQKELIQKVIKDIAKTGIPELNIPPIDPIEMKHVNASILNVIDLELVEGIVKGIKNCIIESSFLDIEHLRASIKLTCDVTIKGKYVVKSSSPVITQLLGGPVHGEGNGKVVIEKITVSIHFPFEVVMRDGETFFKSDLKKYKYTYQIHDKVTFAANNLYLGDKESSQDLIKLLNENWKIIMESFGNHFLDIAMGFVHKFMNNFFYYVPTKHYLIEDVSSYV